MLQREIEALGGRGVKAEPGGCRVRGPLEFGYRLCLWSRLASRVLLLLQDIVAEDETGLYELVRAMSWEDHLSAKGTVAVDFVGEGVGIDHSQYGAQRIKDAIVDRFRDRVGERPSVDRVAPDVRVNVFARGKSCTVGIDLAGESLHRRGYRDTAGPAPLKENLAAALLHFGDWPQIAAEGGGLLDPMCGSGTIAIEAACMVADVAAGLARPRFGFEGWLGHDAAAWRALRDEATDRAVKGRCAVDISIVGCDRDASLIAMARANAQVAGVGDLIEWQTQAIDRIETKAGPGLVVCNPPYGERLGDKAQARTAFFELGQAVRAHRLGWSLAVIAPDDGLIHALGAPLPRSLAVNNGPKDALLVGGRVEAQAPDHPLTNRLRKNQRRLRKWLQRESIACYRLYDADLPEYNAAVDLYAGQAHIQEYEAPETIEPELARERLAQISASVAQVLELPSDRLHVKRRRRQRGRQQYERMAENDHTFLVREGGHSFWVNLTDYLDTGLFLDHRVTRGLIQSMAGGTRFLNLFCYTGAVTVYAAKGGARKTTSVDLSNRYLDWADRNLEVNDLTGPEHQLIRADCLKWLQENASTYDLVFLDPPTFSNSKAMQDTLDIRRDHTRLLELTMKRVHADGVLLFSTNARKFRLDANVGSRWQVEDWTDRTTPEDFRGKTPHRCWMIRHR